MEISTELKLSPQETMIKIAHDPTFPLFVLNLDKGNLQTDPTLNLKVPPEIYERLTSLYGTDSLLFYLDISGKMEAWSPDMLATYRILEKYEIISSFKSWTKTSRKFIVNYLTDTPQELKIPDKIAKERLNKLEEILTYAKLKDSIDNKENLFSIARDVTKSNKKDPDSIVYRLAMMIYHSKRLSGEAAVLEIETPGTIYLRLMDNYDFQEKYKFAYDELSRILPQARSAAVKTLMSFFAAAYLYYKAVYLGGNR